MTMGCPLSTEKKKGKNSNIPLKKTEEWKLEKKHFLIYKPNTNF